MNYGPGRLFPRVDIFGTDTPGVLLRQVYPSGGNIMSSCIFYPFTLSVSLTRSVAKGSRGRKGERDRGGAEEDRRRSECANMRGHLKPRHYTCERCNVSGWTRPLPSSRPSFFSSATFYLRSLSCSKFIISLFKTMDQFRDSRRRRALKRNSVRYNLT